MNRSKQLHENTLKVVKIYKHSEKRLIDLLMQNEEIKAFRTLGYSSLHVYCTQALGLSDATAYAMVQIARKSKEVPEIKKLIQADKLSIANATQIARVITPENKGELLDLGQTLSKRDLEKEIKKLNPEVITKERVTPVNEIYDQVKIFMTNSCKNDLEFLKSYYSKKEKKNLSLSETIAEMARELRDRHDPVRIAQRIIRKEKPKADKEAQPIVPGNKPEKESPSPIIPGNKAVREPIPAGLRHQINLRDLAKCTYTQPDGTRCEEKRWLNFHHIVPVSDGGATTLENLTTICFNHHAYVHEIKLPTSERRSECHTVR